MKPRGADRASDSEANGAIEANELVERSLKI